MGRISRFARIRRVYHAVRDEVVTRLLQLSGDWSKFGRFAKILSGFTLSMLMMAGVALLTIPAMIAASGAKAWAAIAIGQAVGSVSAIVVAYGWGITGPARIRSDKVDNRVEVTESLRVRLLLLTPCALVASLASFILSPTHPMYAAAAAVSTTMVGLSSAWYFAGTREAAQFVLTETLPRVLGGVVAIVAMSNGSTALSGVIIQGLATVLGFVLSTSWICRRLNLSGRSFGLGRPVGQLLKLHWDGLASQVVLGAYAAVPVAIVGVVAAPTQPVFALVDKVQKQINAALSPVVTTVQGFTPSAHYSVSRSRVRRTVALLPIIAAILIAAVGSLGPSLLRFLSAGDIVVTLEQVVLMAVMVGTSFVVSVLVRACLPVMDRTASGVRGTAVGAVCGLLGVAVFGLHWGATGALVGVVSGHVVSAILVLWSIRDILRRPNN